MSSGYTNVIACLRASFLAKLKNTAFYWYAIILFIHPDVDGHLGWIYLLAIVNNPAMDAGRQAYALAIAFILFLHTRSMIARSHSDLC